MGIGNLSQHGDPVRRSLAFLIAVLGLCAVLGGPPLFAEEVMMGRVLSVDREAGEVVVEPVGGYESEDQNKQSQEIRVQYPGDSMPRRLRAGDVIRIWGDFSPENSLEFKATHLGYGAGGRDPTGVRSRINRGFGMKRGWGGGRGQGQGQRGAH